MKPAVWRLLVAGLLFFGWIGWLVYLTTTLQHAVVLSRPQLLAADLDVIAWIDEDPQEHGPSGMVKVKAVFWAREESDRDIETKTIAVDNLPEISKDDGWEGPKEYILPLQRAGGKEKAVYRVAPIPRSPGYGREGPPRIYPATADARRQLQKIRAGEWE